MDLYRNKHHGQESGITANYCYVMHSLIRGSEKHVFELTGTCSWNPVVSPGSPELFLATKNITRIQESEFTKKQNLHERGRALPQVPETEFNYY
jgi:hypothetical protein